MAHVKIGEGKKGNPVSPDSSEVTASIVDLCAQVNAQMDVLRKDYQHSIYEICTSLHNHIAKEMNLMVGHVRRLIDQNAFLYDLVVELEKRDDTKEYRVRLGIYSICKKGKNSFTIAAPKAWRQYAGAQLGDQFVAYTDKRDNSLHFFRSKQGPPVTSYKLQARTAVERIRQKVSE